jgi:hypothetical protein
MGRSDFKPNLSNCSAVHPGMRREKFNSAFSEDAFGVPDVPTKIGHKLLAKLTGKWNDSTRRPDKRTWKRRRKTRWRSQ